MQPPQLRPRLDTELVGEDPAQLVERRERRLLAAGRVERAQPALPQRLAVGVLGEQRDQVRDDPVRVAGGQQGVEAVLLAASRAPRRAGCGPAPAIRCPGRRRRACRASGPVRRRRSAARRPGPWLPRLRPRRAPASRPCPARRPAGSPARRAVPARRRGPPGPARAPGAAARSTSPAHRRRRRADSAPDGVDQRRRGQGSPHVHEQRGGDALYAPAAERPRRPVNLDGQRSEVEKPHQRDRRGAFHLRHSVCETHVRPLRQRVLP